MAKIKTDDKFYKVKQLLNPLFLIMFIFLCVYTVSVIFPLVWGFIQSFRDKFDFQVGDALAFPDLERWETNKNQQFFVDLGYTNILGNYNYLIKQTLDVSTKWTRGIDGVEIRVPTRGVGILECLMNSILYAGVASCLKTLGPVVVGYLCAKYKYKFSTVVYTYVVFVMVTPIVGTTTALLNMVKYVGIHNSWFGLFIRSFDFANMYFLIFYAFFDGVSNSYAEAAEIDGASQFSVMVTIYIPLSMKMIGTVILLNFVTAWNDYSTALMYMPTHPTLAYYIYKLTTSSTYILQSVPFSNAALMTLALPTLIVFIMFRNKLMGNLSLGGVKE